MGPRMQCLSRLTKPEFSFKISESIRVLLPILVEILTAVFTSLNHLKRDIADYAFCNKCYNGVLCIEPTIVDWGGNILQPVPNAQPPLETECIAGLCFNIHKTLGLQLWFLPRDAMQTLPMPSCGSLSVCLCDVRLVTFVNSVETNKRRATFKIFSPSGSQAILHFSYKSA